MLQQTVVLRIKSFQVNTQALIIETVKMTTKNMFISLIQKMKTADKVKIFSDVTIYKSHISLFI